MTKKGAKRAVARQKQQKAARKSANASVLVTEAASTGSNLATEMPQDTRSDSALMLEVDVEKAESTATGSDSTMMQEVDVEEDSAAAKEASVEESQEFESSSPQTFSIEEWDVAFEETFANSQKVSNYCDLLRLYGLDKDLNVLELRKSLSLRAQLCMDADFALRLAEEKEKQLHLHQKVIGKEEDNAIIALWDAAIQKEEQLTKVEALIASLTATIQENGRRQRPHTRCEKDSKIHTAADAAVRESAIVEFVEDAPKDDAADAVVSGFARVDDVEDAPKDNVIVTLSSNQLVLDDSDQSDEDEDESDDDNAADFAADIFSRLIGNDASSIKEVLLAPPAALADGEASNFIPVSKESDLLVETLEETNAASDDTISTESSIHMDVKKTSTDHLFESSNFITEHAVAEDTSAENLDEFESKSSDCVESIGANETVKGATSLSDDYTEEEDKALIFCSSEEAAAEDVVKNFGETAPAYAQSTERSELQQTKEEQDFISSMHMSTALSISTISSGDKVDGLIKVQEFEESASDTSTLNTTLPAPTIEKDADQASVNVVESIRCFEKSR
ncbi:hypothetical protein HDU97_009100 [Phlyctochytrium planicorne]|nr:hypothetical protein HDU97_009100 [Phlyctochytrium planicorne]